MSNPSLRRRACGSAGADDVLGVSLTEDLDRLRHWVRPDRAVTEHYQQDALIECVERRPSIRRGANGQPVNLGVLVNIVFSPGGTAGLGGGWFVGSAPIATASWDPRREMNVGGWRALRSADQGWRQAAGETCWWAPTITSCDRRRVPRCSLRAHRGGARKPDDSADAKRRTE